MHEFSIVENMVRTAESFANEHNIKHVSCLTIRIGALTGVISEYVSMYYKDLTPGTALEGSELKVEEVSAEAFCKICGEVFDPTESEQKCPACGKSNYEILHGEELTVKEMGYM